MGLILNDLKNACELEHVCDYVNNRTTSSMNYISTENMLPNKGGISESTIIPPGTTTEYKIGDILISNIRPYFQKIWCADRCGGCSADVLCIRAKENTDSKYLYYLLSQQAFFDYVMSGAKGCKMPRGDKKQIMQWPVNIPAIDVQKKVVAILSSLDNKIRLNRRINDNLEQQAQALFKSWFVDNSNPNWEETSLSEVASFVGGYSYTGEELTDCSNIAMATIKNFGRNGGFKADGFKEINPSAKLKECHYANLFDILVAHTDLTQNADVIGNAELLLTYGKYNSIIFSMDLVKVLPKETFPYRFLLAAMLKNKLFKGHSLGYVNGTTVLHLSKKALPDFEIRKPSDSESKMMDEVLASYYKRMAELLQENDRLISLRDTLIPKLMSGKLKINDLNC